MSRLLPVTSQRLFLLEALQALAYTTAEATTVASSLVEDCLVALTLEEMCHIVKTHGQVGYRQHASVIDQALEALERQLYYGSSGQWSLYWQRVRETLKQPALQLETLQARLITPLRTEEPPERQRVEVDVAVPFELLHLPELEGLVAVPLQAQCHLDLERVQAQEGWVLRGEYFPFELQVGELLFVVTAAAEVIVLIQHFPRSLVRQAWETLRTVAQTLYTVNPPPFTATIPEPEGGGDYPFVDEAE
jgi:hypothetical protein